MKTMDILPMWSPNESDMLRWYSTVPGGPVRHDAGALPASPRWSPWVFHPWPIVATARASASRRRGSQWMPSTSRTGSPIQRPGAPSSRPASSSPMSRRSWPPASSCAMQAPKRRYLRQPEPRVPGGDLRNVHPVLTSPRLRLHDDLLGRRLLRPGAPRALAGDCAAAVRLPGGSRSVPSTRAAADPSASRWSARAMVTRRRPSVRGKSTVDAPAEPA